MNRWRTDGADDVTEAQIIAAGSAAWANWCQRPSHQYSSPIQLLDLLNYELFEFGWRQDYLPAAAEIRNECAWINYLKRQWRRRSGSSQWGTGPVLPR